MSSNVADDVVVQWDAAESRYVALLDGHVAGSAFVEVADGEVVFTHTVVEDEFEGRGIGSTLVAAALAEVRESGRTVVARCPFVAAHLRRHPELAG